MPWDLAIDPLTGDFAWQTEGDGAGGFVTTENADTAVRRALLEVRGAWWGDPEAGAEFDELWQLGDGDAAELFARDACRRALQRLIDAGRIADLDIAVTRDRVGRFTIETRFRNVRTGLPSAVAITPLGA
jgi:phage gp46-like protein